MIPICQISLCLNSAAAASDPPFCYPLPVFLWQSNPISSQCTLTTPLPDSPAIFILSVNIFLCVPFPPLCYPCFLIVFALPPHGSLLIHSGGPFCFFFPLFCPFFLTEFLRHYLALPGTVLDNFFTPTAPRSPPSNENQPKERGKRLFPSLGHALPFSLSNGSSVFSPNSDRLSPFQPFIASFLIFSNCPRSLLFSRRFSITRPRFFNYLKTFDLEPPPVPSGASSLPSQTTPLLSSFFCLEPSLFVPNIGAWAQS